MSDERRSRIDAIRARLNAAVEAEPLPWHAIDGEIRGGCGGEHERSVLSCCNIEEDALPLIANAPDDLAWLLAELDAAMASDWRSKIIRSPGLDAPAEWARGDVAPKFRHLIESRETPLMPEAIDPQMEGCGDE